MSPSIFAVRVLVVSGALLLALAACGRRGALEEPPLRRRPAAGRRARQESCPRPSERAQPRLPGDRAARRSPSSSTRFSSPGAPRDDDSCTISPTADGVLHAEDVDLRTLADDGRHAVLLLFHGDARAALPGLRGRLRGHGCARLLRHEGELEPGGAATLARLGAGMDIVSEGELRRALAAGVPGERIVFSGVAKTRERDGGRPRQRHPLLQRRIGARARGALGGRRVQGRARADLDPGQSRTSTPGPTARSRPAGPRTSSASRSPAPGTVYARAARLAGPRGRPASTCISAARSPTLQPYDNATRAPRRARPRPDGRRPPARPHRPRRRPRHSLPRRQRAAARSRRPMRRSSSATPATSA